jgi:hypothetical protein
MVLNRLEKEIDITEISTAPPETNAGRPFDAETELDPEFADKFEVMFELESRHGAYKALMPRAKNFKRLFPESFKELDLEQMWAYCIQSFNETQFFDTYRVVSRVSSMKELFPDRFNAILHLLPRVGVTNSGNLKTKAFSEMMEMLEDNDPNSIFFARSIRTVLPNLDMLQEIAQRRNSHETPDTVRAYLQQMLKIARHNKGLFNILKLTEACKVVFPEDVQNQLKLTYAEWEEFRKELEGYRSGGEVLKYMDLAADMKVVAAETVSVTDQGLEFTMPPKGFSAKPLSEPFPNERTF